jgi:hypothetical protein
LRNPFNIGVAQEKDDFCNRITEKEELLKYARNAQKVVFYSSRCTSFHGYRLVLFLRLLMTRDGKQCLV